MLSTSLCCYFKHKNSFKTITVSQKNMQHEAVFHRAIFHLTMCSLTQNNIISVFYGIQLILKPRTDSPVKIRTRNQLEITPWPKTFLSVLVSTNLFKMRKWIAVWLNFMQMWGRCHLKWKLIIYTTAKRLDIGKDR